jgi:hypothetical protein
MNEGKGVSMATAKNFEYIYKKKMMLVTHCFEHHQQQKQYQYCCSTFAVRLKCPFMH